MSDRAAMEAANKRLYDLARDGLEPSDPKVKEKYDAFRIDVTSQALKILRERIPTKILAFNDLVDINAGPSQVLHTRDLVPFEPPRYTVANADLADAEDSARPPTAKRQRSAEGGSQALVESLPNGFSHAVYPEAVSAHPQIKEGLARIRVEALELIEMVGTVKLWIQLNVPRIEDGNNFGVAIQEEAIQELGRVEDAALSLCDGIKYHTNRAKLVSKCFKYPNVEDYTQSIRNLDNKEWLHIKVAQIDMRNSYSMLYDLLHKNWEKVVKPRPQVDGSFMCS